MKLGKEDPHGREANSRRFGFMLLLNFGGTEADIVRVAQNLTASDWEVFGAQDGKDMVRQLKNPRDAQTVIREVMGGTA